MAVTEKTTSRWRHQARAVIAKVLASMPADADEAIKRAAVSLAYPFGQRENFPYKQWLIEVRLAFSELSGSVIKHPTIPSWYPVIDERDRAFLDEIRQSDLLDRDTFAFDGTTLGIYGDWLQELGGKTALRGAAWVLLTQGRFWPAKHGKRWRWAPWHGHSLTARHELRAYAYWNLTHGGVVVNARQYGAPNNGVTRYPEERYHEYHSVFHALCDFAQAWRGDEEI